MWKQLIFPNLDDKSFVVHHPNGSILSSWLGWCLAVTQKQFGVAPFAPTARQAWEWNKDKHADYDLPNGMFVPIFWTGDRNNWGHIAIALREGSRVKIWTSPWRHKPYLDYFEGEIYEAINRLGKLYGMAQYVGWSTMLNNTKIIEWVEPPKPKSLKSNEEICAEIWQSKWGNGKERWNKLSQAGYDPKVIQDLIDKGVGKPKPVDPPKPKPEPTPEPESAPEINHELPKKELKEPKKPEMPPETSNAPNNEVVPKDDTNIVPESQNPSNEPSVLSDFPKATEKTENAPVVPDMINSYDSKTKISEKQPQTGGGFIRIVLNILQNIIKILTTKKEK